MGDFARNTRKRKIENVSWGLATRMSDLALLSLFLTLALSMPSKHTGKFLADIFSKIRITENETKIRSVFYQLKRHGLIDYSRRLINQPLITALGRKRLKALLPEYLAYRPWDKRLYLVSYDIPEKSAAERGNLRRLLKTLGAGMLQESIWLTPYNPKELLREFVLNNDLIGMVIVSDLGKDGSIGEEDQRSLVNRVYQLDELNRRYRDFLETWEKKQAAPELLAYYFSILKDDPQLPFELLPDDWLGEKAWESVKSVSTLSGR